MPARAPSDALTPPPLKSPQKGAVAQPTLHLWSFVLAWLWQTWNKNLSFCLLRRCRLWSAKIPGLSRLLNQPNDLLMCQSVTADDEVIRVFTEVLLKSPARW